MKKKDFYTPPDPALWSGRHSGKQEYLHEKVGYWEDGVDQEFSTDGNNYVLLGYACDEGIRRNSGRTGAAEGPDAIRRELGKLANPITSQDSFADMGNIHCSDGNLETAQEALSAQVKKIAEKGALPLLLGGGHDIAYGHYKGLRTALDKTKSLGIINFDAHFDLRTNENGNHSGSPFYQIARDCKQEGTAFQYLCLGIRREANPRELFDRAKELGVKYLELPDFNMHKSAGVQELLNALLSKTDRVYVTVDMDGFSSAYSPGVSAANPMGFTPEIVLSCLQKIISSGKLMGIDVAETSPQWDRDSQTAKLAAGIIHFAMRENSLL